MYIATDRPLARILQKSDVVKWCSNCIACNSRKSPPRNKAPLEVSHASRPLERIAMDIMGPLPETPRGNRYILVVGDYFTKWKEAYPLPDIEALSIAKVLVNEFICRFGVPDSIHTDQGKNFEAKVIQDFLESQRQEQHPIIRSPMDLWRDLIGPYWRCSALQWLMNMTGTFLSQHYFWHIEQVSRKLLEPHHSSSCLGATPASLRTFFIHYPWHHMIQLLSIPRFSRAILKDLTRL